MATIQYPASKENGPEGLPRGWKDLLRIMPLNDQGRGALIGRVGSADPEPFLVAGHKAMRVMQAGRLFLGINQPSTDEATGSFKVKIQIVPAAGGNSSGTVAVPDNKLVGTSSPAAANASVVMPKITPEILAKIPRRVSDPDGRPGDMVNFLILGSEDKLRLAFGSAGWVKVDRTPKDAVLHGLLSSLSKESYVEMPMSTLTLFGRPQDYGFAHADPLTVVATRNHLRVWKAPFDVEGVTLWVGAGTHDIGFERDQRNGGITHKIDPAIDGERDYIGQTLGSTGIVAKQDYVKPSDALTEARTATGGTFHSDGRILVMMLTPSGNDRSTAFADLFCSVLGEEHPDAGDWGGCAQYVHATPSGKSVALGPIPAKYRVLILPGVLNSCESSIPAFQKGQQHLHDAHGLAVEYLTLPNDSSEANGKLIADYLKTHSKGDPRKYIVVAYSKGAPDFQVGVAQDGDAASAVAAFVTVAGAIGGSPVAAAMPAVVERYTKALKLGTCQGDLALAFKSLGRDVRHAFLASYPDPVVPTYSLIALSDASDTSKMLLEAWQLLSVYDTNEDSQLTKEDAVVPGSTFLGAARADHLAIALPFEDLADGEIRSFMDHNRYPRSALLEALVRFAIEDVEKPQ